MKKHLSLTLAVFIAVYGLHCASWNKTEQGAVIGAAAGGAAGGVIGHYAGNTAVGAIIGAAVGGAAGAFIGNYMDRQAAEIERDIENAKVERVAEGIKITFDTGLLFDVDKTDLKKKSYDELTKLSEILNKYEDTHILLEGHTDATGTEEYNLQLSRERAQSVSVFLETQKVDSARFTIMGYGEAQPVAANDTRAGRQQNRRVEVAIYANDKLKNVAESKAEEQK